MTISDWDAKVRIRAMHVKQDAERHGLSPAQLIANSLPAMADDEDMLLMMCHVLLWLGAEEERLRPMGSDAALLNHWRALDQQRRHGKESAE